MQMKEIEKHKKVVRDNFKLENVNIDVINNDEHAVIIINPFNGDKVLHNKVEVNIIFEYHDEKIPEDHCKIILNFFRKNIEEEIIPNNSIGNRLTEYVKMIKEAIDLK